MKKINELKCKVKGCRKPFCTNKDKLCPAHLMRLRRKGYIGDGKIRGYTSSSEFKIYQG